MKIQYSPITAKHLGTILLLALTSVVQAQFTCVTNFGFITITGYTGSDSEVVIPNAINGWPVDNILSAFHNNTNLTSVTIPDSVTVIGQEAFFGCSNLTGVKIGNGVNTIQSFVFQDCTKLTSITLPDSVTLIQRGAFIGCSSLTNINLGRGTQVIGDFSGGAFGGCSTLASITMPASLNTVSSWEFGGCTNLTSIFFAGNAPDVTPGNFVYNLGATAYYLPGAAGWSNSLAGMPAVLWNPQIQNSSLQTNGFHFNITGTTNIPIVLEASTSLANPSWILLQNCTLTNGSVYFCDEARTNYPVCFYRIRSP